MILERIDSVLHVQLSLKFSFILFYIFTDVYISKFVSTVLYDKVEAKILG